jgi:hypothetical protein
MFTRLHAANGTHTYELHRRSACVWWVTMASTVARALLLLCCGTALSSSLRQPLFMDDAQHVISAYKLSREIVESRWKETWSEDLPCATPRYKGHVQKLGLGPQSPTLGLTISQAEHYVFARLPIYIGCQVSLAQHLVMPSLLALLGRVSVSMAFAAIGKVTCCHQKSSKWI